MRTATRLMTWTAMAVALVLLSPHSALGAWSNTGTGTGTTQAASLSAPAAGSAVSASSTSLTVSVTTAPATGPVPSGYRVDQTSPGTVSNVCGGISGSTGSCTYSSLTSGTTYTLAIFSKVGNNWVASSALSVSGTPAALPTVAFAFPSASGSYGNNGAWQKNCPSQTDGVCGTATGGSGTLTSVSVVLQRTVSSTVTYWNGSSWQSGSTSVTASGTTNWLLGITYTQLRTGATGTSSYTATVTANAGATATASRSFTVS